jgi:hypothetical protein
MRREFVILLALHCDGSNGNAQNQDQQPSDQPATQGQTTNPAPTTGTEGETHVQSDRG